MGYTKKDDKSLKLCVKKKCNPMIRKTARFRNKHFKGMDENIKKLKHAHNLKCSAGSKSNLNKIIRRKSSLSKTLSKRSEKQQAQ